MSQRMYPKPKRHAAQVSAAVVVALLLAACVNSGTANQAATTSTNTTASTEGTETTTTAPVEIPVALAAAVEAEGDLALNSLMAEMSQNHGAENVDATHLDGAALRAAQATTASVTYLYGELFHDPRYFDEPPEFVGNWMEIVEAPDANSLRAGEDGTFVMDAVLFNPTFPIAGAFHSFVVELGDDGHLKIVDFVVDAFPWNEDAWWVSDVLLDASAVEMYVTLADGRRVDGVGEVKYGWVEVPRDYDEWNEADDVKSGAPLVELLVEVTDPHLRLGDGFGGVEPTSAWANWGLAEARWDFVYGDSPLTLRVMTPAVEAAFVHRRAMTQLPVTYDGEPAGLWLVIPEREVSVDVCEVSRFCRLVNAEE